MINKPVTQFRIGAIGGLLATAIAMMSQLLTVEVMDISQKMGVIFLAVSIPLLGFDLYLLASELLSEKSYRSRLRGLLRLIAIFMFFIATTCLFFHFSVFAGFAFAITLLISIVFFAWLYRAKIHNNS